MEFAGIIPAGLEIVFAFGRLEESGAALQDSKKADNGALGQFSQRAFSLEITISMGLKSGLYGGRYRTVQFFLARISATLGLL